MASSLNSALGEMVARARCSLDNFARSAEHFLEVNEGFVLSGLLDAVLPSDALYRVQKRACVRRAVRGGGRGARRPRIRAGRREAGTAPEFEICAAAQMRAIYASIALW